MKGRCRGLALGALLAGLCAPPAASAAAAVPDGAPPPADSVALQRECEYGIVLALAGRHAAAESVFVSLLTHAPGDARALTNLGNLSLMRGELDLALAFYARAAAGDSADAGILLNQATALMLQGEEELARARARQGIALAGGTNHAARLLGLPETENGEDDTPKAAGHAWVSKEEVRSLLAAAAGQVPRDSVRAGADPAGSAAGKPKRRAPAWRSGGARASEGTEAATVVYWKR